MLQGDGAAALSFAGVLALTAGFLGAAATLTLAFVLAAALVMGRGGAAALALAGVLPRATSVAGLAATLAFALVPALADVLGSLVIRLLVALGVVGPGVSARPSPGRAPPRSSLC